MTVHSAVCARSPTHHSHTDADAGAGGRGSAVRGVSPTRQGAPPRGGRGAVPRGAVPCRVPRARMRALETHANGSMVTRTGTHTRHPADRPH